ncbi:NADH:ubiquinone reductase (Na(+)-transporting) subunit C [Cecembia lonarensis]|uniref:Na(+)-translocating NADH-quinone reductase subunit C n=1 Tax=Cecembia lonarensis (strain CCUG 58316 / KCTC 22772 / LW9) TaxID=1225176 RepID=K1LCN2_CECL9|nr:NADH:ubiquinone reductase (Na(+)-transporting) subunit C [Cecembia lonarensis]EKB48173.1 Na(+)-translocating NADH-quinone reductase subunit C [Cecembia lonarensis LW9]
MQQSNAYIITFSVILTVVLGLLLSGTSQVLAPIQKKAVELDTKKQILGAVLAPSEIRSMKPDEILDFYDNRITSKVVDIEGNLLEKDESGNPIIAENVNVAKNYKMAPEKRMYPMFVFHKEGNPEAVEAYIVQVYGAGLWDEIWGFLALDTDLNTIAGVTFGHKAETPGLGARITENAVQDRFRGKRLFDDGGNFQSVAMQKGEGRDYSDDDHKVDGLSGATITANGVNAMFRNYLQAYKAYFDKLRDSGASESLALN